ncbi:PHPT1 family protein [Megaselia abdita]
MFATRLARTFFGSIRKMEAKLDAIPLVDIDPEGIFKYILIKVHGPVKDGVEPSKHIVRGYARAQWHNDIYEEVAPGIEGLGFDAECVGGGRIEHLPEKKKLKVYGHSTGFGKADHSISREVLKTKYSNYEIEISDEGY